MVIEDLQEILAQAWRPLLCDKHVCMTDATCYESHLRYPTDMKLLWESMEWLHRQIVKQCVELHIRRSRNKFDNVSVHTCPIARSVSARLHVHAC